MSTDGGHRRRGGRRQPDRADDRSTDEQFYNGRGDAYWDYADSAAPPGYNAGNGYGWQAGYDQQGGYAGSGDGDPAGYGGRGRYPDQERYSDRAGYGSERGYGGQAGYGAQESYQDDYAPGGYGEPSPYREPHGYGDQGGYAGSGYADPGYAGSGYGDPRYADPGYADPRGYGAGGSGHGRHSAATGPDLTGQDRYGGGYGPDVDTNPYGPGSYGQERPYGSADSYGPGSAGPYGSAGRRAIESGSGAGQAGDERSPDTYGAADSRADGSYGSSGYRDAGYDTGSFGRADTGSHGGWAFTPGSTNGFGPGDSGSFGRPDSGSFGRPDSGSFGRPDKGSYFPDDDYDADHDPRQDTGSIRWTSGPPPARNRADRDGDDPISVAGHGSLAGESAGYADWRDDPVDDEWDDDDAAGGLLSRRFGGGAPEDRRGARARRRSRKRGRVRSKAAFTGAIVAVALFVGVAAAFGYRYVHTWIDNRYGDYSGTGSGTVKIIVASGDNLVGLGPLLLSKGVIMAVRPYDTAANAASGTLQPGVYALHQHMNSAIAVQWLLSSKHRAQIKVTIIPGTREDDIAIQLANATGLNKNDFLSIIHHPPRALGLPSWAGGKTAEGFLFPDTYTFVPKESALQILQTMVSDFRSQIASLNLVSQAKTVNTTAWHVLIVASMVQAESGPGDFGKVARVAWNRLIQGMPLHFDSTVFYGLGIKGNSHAAATSAEIKQNTPYNTYLHTGLPPGPIGNPQLAAIKAALHPTHGQWLYFITDLKTGVTHFTSSYSQFQQWQQQYQG
jgi:UPF0755 protein